MKTVAAFHRFAGALLCLGAAASPSRAAQSDPPKFDPIVVTPTGAEKARSKTTPSVTVITREQIEHAQATDVAELLRFTAGVELGRNGGPGQLTSVFIRGANSNHTLVLIDGVRVNRLASGGATLENITPDMIDHIEIVKGPRATLYGSDAVGGVINIITRRARGVTASARVRAGSFQTLDAGAFGGYGNADHQVSAHAQHQETRGIPAVAGEEQPSNFRQNSFELAGSTTFGPITLGARGWDARSRAGYYTFDPATFALDLPASQNLHNTLVAFDAAAEPLSNWHSTLTAAESLDRIEQREAPDFLRSRRPSITWHNVIAAPVGNRVSFGGEAAQENVEALTFGTPVAERRDLATAFAQDEIDVGNHHALIAGGFQHNEAFGHHWNWNLEYGYDLPADVRVFAAAGTGFRAPTAAERFGFGANPDLQPETARNYEAGVREQINRATSVELRAFQMDVENLINALCDASFNCTLFNVAQFRNRGVELAYRYDDANWSADVTGVIQDPRDRSNGSQLARRAKRSIAARLTRRFGDRYVGVDILGTSSRPDLDVNTGAPVTDGGYALLSLSAGMQLGRHFKVEARAENLLDADYQTAAGYDQPGLSGYGTVIYSY